MLRRTAWVGGTLVRGRGVEVAGRTIPGVVVVSVGFSSMRALRLLKFISSILLSPVSRVR